MDPNIKFGDGVTPLMLIANFSNDPSLIHVLLEYGADPALKDNYNKRAIDYAKENKNIKGTEAYWLLNDLSW